MSAALSTMRQTFFGSNSRVATKGKWSLTLTLFGSSHMPAFGFVFTLSALLQLALAALATKEPSRSSILQPDTTTTHSAAAAPSIPGPGWQEIINHNVPRGRTAPAVCAGPWGIMSFAGAIHEHRMVNETWLLPALGGNWTFLPPAAGRRKALPL